MSNLGILSVGETPIENIEALDINCLNLKEVDFNDIDAVLLFKNKGTQIEKMIQWLLDIQKLDTKPIWIWTTDPLGEEKMMYLKLGVCGFFCSSDTPEGITLKIKNTLRCFLTELDKKATSSFSLDSSDFSVTINQKMIMLTRSEYILLDYLNSPSNVVRSYKDISEYLWSIEKEIPKYRIANIIFHLRTKLGKIDPKYGEIIRTIRSKGYMLDLNFIDN